MIEVHLLYDVKPNIDEQVYFEWLKKEIIKILKTQRIVEVSAHRNLKELSKVLVVALWENMDDWTAFSQSEALHSLTSTLEHAFAENLRIEVWEPSPFLPTPLRPHK